MGIPVVVLLMMVVAGGLLFLVALESPHWSQKVLASVFGSLMILDALLAFLHVI